MSITTPTRNMITGNGNEITGSLLNLPTSTKISYLLYRRFALLLYKLTYPGKDAIFTFEEAMALTAVLIGATVYCCDVVKSNEIVFTELYSPYRVFQPNPIR